MTATQRGSPGPAPVPDRLVRGLEALRRWRAAGVVLVPVRHHSPGCAAALTRLLEDVRPARVLIEGPREYTALLPALGDERTKPPVAVLSTGNGRAAFYPLAAFSPEWVALRWGLSAGAVVDFIDQSYADQVEPRDAGVRTLQAETHLGRSASIAALAARLGCRDHDEVWEHLFEVRTPDQVRQWPGFFDDVFAWSALARLDSDRELLDADGTHAREAVMGALLERHRPAGDGPIVVVTGGFHTLALLDVLDGTPEAEWVRAQRPAELDPQRPAYLIRYDYARLDGLRGYGAGMPAPGFWQRVWRARTAVEPAGPRSLVTDVLLDVAARLRQDGEPLGAATVQAAAEQALRLAALRDRPWPGRTDVLDAMLSCFAKDDSGFSGALGAAIAGVFGGTALGEVPPGLASPPLVAEVRRGAERLHFNVSDAEVRTVSLDTQRRPAHVRRREFLARVRFTGCGFARQTGGADLVTGTALGQLFEEWQYAWTPLVEAALIEASLTGPTLDAVVRARFAQRLAEPQAGSAQLATLIAEILVMGLPDLLPEALDALAARYDQEPSLAALVASLHALANLRLGGRLDLGGHADALRRTLDTGLAATSYQVAQLGGVGPDEAPATCSALVSLRDLMVRLEADDHSDDRAAAGAIRRELARLRSRRDVQARVRGCLVGLGFADRELTDADLEREIAGHLSPGTVAEDVAAFLQGALEASPDLLLHNPDLLVIVDQRLAALDEKAFLAILPDLRQAFTFLKPTETHRLATLVARHLGVSADELDTVVAVDPALAAVAVEIERELVASLRRDGLGSWVAT